MRNSEKQRLGKVCRETLRQVLLVLPAELKRHPDFFEWQFEAQYGHLETHVVEELVEQGLLL